MKVYAQAIKQLRKVEGLLEQSEDIRRKAERLRKRVVCLLSAKKVVRTGAKPGPKPRKDGRKKWSAARKANHKRAIQKMWQRRRAGR